VIASRARLMRRIDAWDELRDTYTRMCADRGHELALGLEHLVDQLLVGEIGRHHSTSAPRFTMRVWMESL
jgi:hypothetical protein